jgi:hypothetical protein
MNRTPYVEPPPEEDEVTQRIGAEGTEPVGAPARSGTAQSKETEEMLDAALACTFPASDPIGCLSSDFNCCPPDDE